MPLTDIFNSQFPPRAVDPWEVLAEHSFKTDLDTITAAVRGYVAAFKEAYRRTPQDNPPVLTMLLQSVDPHAQSAHYSALPTTVMDVLRSASLQLPVLHDIIEFAWYGQISSREQGGMLFYLEGYLDKYSPPNDGSHQMAEAVAFRTKVKQPYERVKPLLESSSISGTRGWGHWEEYEAFFQATEATIDAREKAFSDAGNDLHEDMCILALELGKILEAGGRDRPYYACLQELTCKAYYFKNYFSPPPSSA